MWFAYYRCQGSGQST